jgi:hypothetical protein
VAGVDHVLRDGAVGVERGGSAELVAGRQGVLAVGVDGEALTVTDLVQAGGVTVAVGDPVPPSPVAVPVVISDEAGAHLRQFTAAPAAVPGAMGASHGEEHSDLHEECFFSFAGRTPVAVEVGEEAAVLGIGRSLDPERQQLVRQVRPGERVDGLDGFGVGHENLVSLLDVEPL